MFNNVFITSRLVSTHFKYISAASECSNIYIEFTFRSFDRRFYPEQLTQVLYVSFLKNKQTKTYPHARTNRFKNTIKLQLWNLHPYQENKSSFKIPVLFKLLLMTVKFHIDNNILLMTISIAYLADLTK